LQSARENNTSRAFFFSEDYAGWVAKALQQDTTSTTTARLPTIDAHDAVATFPNARGHFRDAASEHGAEPEDMDE